MLRSRRSPLVVFAGVGFLALWFDVALGHGSAGIKHPGMWLPLVVLPCAATASILTAARATARSRRVFHLFCYGTILIGLLGFAFHLARFVNDLKGAVQWEVLVRLMRYPPLLAPLAVSALGVLGLLVDDSEGGERG